MRQASPYGLSGLWGALADHVATVLWALRERGSAPAELGRAWALVEQLVDAVQRREPRLRARSRLFRFDRGGTAPPVELRCGHLLPLLPGARVAGSTAATACARPARAAPTTSASANGTRANAGFAAGQHRAPPVLPGPARADGLRLAAETAGDSTDRADRADRADQPAGPVGPAQPTWAPATSMPAPAGTSAMSITLCRWCTPAGSSTARRAAATASTAVACDCRRPRAASG